jgi:hypothetical protein
MIAEGGTSSESRLAYGFRLATARQPKPKEMKVLADGLKADLDRFAHNIDAAKKLIADGQSKPRPSLKPDELAAYTLAANVILNLDEVLTRE